MSENIDGCLEWWGWGGMGGRIKKRHKEKFWAHAFALHGSFVRPAWGGGGGHLHDGLRRGAVLALA